MNNQFEISQEEGYFPKDSYEKFYKCQSLCSEYRNSKYVDISYYYEITEQVKVSYEKINNYSDYLNNRKRNNRIFWNEDIFISILYWIFI